jgi:ribonuclease R
VSGLVHITQLPNDYYHFDPKKHLLSGERRGLKFRLGDPVRVLVLRASLEDRKIDFRLVSAEGQSEQPLRQPPPRQQQRAPGGQQRAPGGQQRAPGGAGKQRGRR